MRPQELYPSIGELTSRFRAHVERLALLRVDVELWNPDELRVDSGTEWSADETYASLVADLGRAENSLSAAVANLESAWSALGRLSAD